MNEQFIFFLINLLSRILIQSDGTRVPGPSIQTKITPDYRIQRWSTFSAVSWLAVLILLEHSVIVAKIRK